MRPLIVYLLGCFILVSITATWSSAANLKHRRSVYADNAQDPLSKPEGVACRGERFVVADTGNQRLVYYRITPQSITAEQVVPLEGSVPLMVKLDAAGDSYVLDGKKRVILRVSADGKPLGAVEPSGIPAPETYVPRSFAFAPDGGILILDIFAERILHLDADGTYVNQTAFPDGYDFFSDLAVGPDGTLYLLDSVAGDIYRKTAAQDSFELFSTDLKEFTNFPTSLALDSRGEVYLLDQYGSGLVTLGRDGSFQGRKFGMGWEDSQFHYPTQLCISEQNLLMVADRSSHRIQVFTILEE